MTIILDTNVLIDAGADEYSACRRIMKEVIAGRIQAVVSRNTRGEHQHMARKRLRTADDRELISEFLRAAKEIPRVAKLEFPLEDPDDVKFLALAKASRAEYLITNDHVLLQLEKFDETRIVTPSQFWNAHTDKNGDRWSQWVSNWMR